MLNVEVYEDLGLEHFYLNKYQEHGDIVGYNKNKRAGK